MAGNEWINSYLDAILDTGERVDDRRLSDVGSDRSGGGEKNAFQAAKYFVEEVTGFDDKALYKTWMKATVTRNGLARSSRLENMCWRIWHIARKKKQVEREDARRVATRNMDRDQSRRDATEDMSEDLSEGEKVESSQEGGARLARLNSDAQLAFNPDEQKEKRLYMVLISLHGLVRGENMELGRDSDTGGQVKYVVELARALAIMPEVYRVDLLTRQICAPEVDWSYGEPTEMLTPLATEENICHTGDSSGAYIVRIPCGPRDQYIRKELLWPHIQEFVDGALAHILNMAKVLGDQIAGGEFVWPHVIHGHYADAGDSASLLSGALNVPMVLTGHSLGRNKLEQLLKQGRHTHEDINATYRIMRRIEAEELSLDAAELVITSTKQEIEEQWGLYDGFNVKVEKVLRLRTKRGLGCHGRYMPRMVVIPPGMDFSNVDVQDMGDIDSDVDIPTFAGSEAIPATPSSPRREPPIWSGIMRFFSNPHKPMILALARPDPKKNITTLLKAFGECYPLRELANLTLIMGNRDDIDEMSGGNAIVLTTVLKLIDRYDLYGQVAYPKHHTQSEVPDIYRLAAKTKGVFINPALVEPFGLTLIEAAAHGLPMVATKNGGPVDILRTLNNGMLVDPHDDKQIAEALRRLVADRGLWAECRRNGLKNIQLYSWPEHCRIYLSRIALCRMRHPEWQNDANVDGDPDAESQGDSLRDVRDLRLSVDGDKLPPGSLSNPADLEKALRISASDQLQRSPSKRLARLESMHEESQFGSRGSNSSDKTTQSSSTMPARIPIRRRKTLIIIAVDSYDASTGEPDEEMVKTVQGILRDFKSEGSGRATGYILSTALSLTGTQALLNRAGLSVLEFDAIVCSSGSKLYYPSDGGDLLLEPDADYDAHIDYRWGGEGLKKTMARYIAGSDDETVEKRRIPALAEDAQGCNAHCHAYRVVNSSVVPAVDALRQVLRKRGLRCHVIYTEAATKLHLLPLLASRSQAMRYLFVRWGLDVARMLLFVGETGDTDYEEMLSGTHKTVVLKGAVQTGSDKLLRAPTSYHKDDVVPAESPNIVLVDNNSGAILDAVRKFGLQF